MQFAGDRQKPPTTKGRSYSSHQPHGRRAFMGRTANGSDAPTTQGSRSSSAIGRTRPDLDFRQAESVVVKDGRRLLSLSSARSAIFTIEWDLQAQTLATTEYRTVYL